MRTRFILLMLALAGAGSLFAQQIITPLVPEVRTKTDQFFKTEPVGNTNIKFHFNLPSGNRMLLEFHSIAQLDSLPDIDSLLAAVWKDLQNFEDSLSIPLVNRRVDYMHNINDNKIRILQYHQMGSIYSVRNGDVTQLKIEQDTLRIRLFTRDGRRVPDIMLIDPYYVTFFLNNISDLKTITGTININAAVAILKADVPDKAKHGKGVFERYYAVYDVEKLKRTYPVGHSIRTSSQKTWSLAPPYVQMGIQFVRGGWSPSVGIGVDVVNRVREYMEEHYRLIYEPYFLFDKDPTGKVLVQGNGFLTFKYSHYTRITTSTNEIKFSQNVSIGYLVHKKGNWFEDVTVKLALPGIQWKQIMLEPEFILSNHATPSLKLTYVFW